MLRLQISCVERVHHENVHEQVQFIGGRYSGVRWRLCSADAIHLIERGRYSFYVVSEGEEEEVVVGTSRGVKYLRTESDDELPCKLLALSPCK